MEIGVQTEIPTADQSGYDCATGCFINNGASMYNELLKDLHEGLKKGLEELSQEKGVQVQRVSVIWEPQGDKVSLLTIYAYPTGAYDGSTERNTNAEH